MIAFLLVTMLAAVQSPAAQPALTDFTANSGAPRTPEQLAVSFEKADLSFRVDPSTKTIEGDATLTFLALSEIRAVVVDLDRNLPVRDVAVGGTALPRTAWRNPEGRLTVTLPEAVAAGKEVAVRIRYGGKPHVANRAPWDGGFVWSKAPTGEPWIATAVQGEGCDLFWPCIDHPMAEPKVVTQHITVPSPLVAAGNGIAQGMEESHGWRTYHWTTRNPNSYAISLNIGPFEKLASLYLSRFGNTIPMEFYYLRGNEAKAKELFTEFPKMLDFFEGYIGPYPFGSEKFGVVETPHLGMEHQTINAYGNGYKKAITGYDWLLQHEFAHEWFGNQLTNSDWDDMWLHEGLGSYMQPLYLGYLYGDRGYFSQMQTTRGGIQNAAPIISGKTKRVEDVYQVERGGPGGDIYGKASYVMHVLRNLIGDEAFFTAVRRLVYGTATPKPGNFAPRYGTTNEFVAIVNEVTGSDYNWFFDVYLREAALPELETTRDAGGLALAWKTPANRPFPMPVEVRVNDRVEKVAMTGGRGRVEIPPSATWTVDPHSKLLRHEPHIEAWKKFEEQQKKAEEKEKKEKKNKK